MAQRFDPSGFINGSTAISKHNLVDVAADIRNPLTTIDGGGYGRANTAWLLLNPGALPGATFTVTAASWSGGTATLTIGAHTIVMGQHFSAQLIVPTGYNGSDLVATGVTGTQVSFALASNPGAYTSGGTVIVAGVASANGMLAADAAGVPCFYRGGAFRAIPGFVRCRSTNTATQSIPNNTYTAITWDTNVFDTDSVHSTSSNSERFVVPPNQGGLYQALAAGQFAASATGQRVIRISLNGIVSYEAYVSAVANNASAGNTMQVSTIQELSAGDYIDLRVFLDSGGALAFQPYFFTVLRMS